MIDQPQFPQSFKQLMLTVVNEQLEADQIKARINPTEVQGLFNRIDMSRTGEISALDFVNFLKVYRISISPKEIDFLSKSLGLKDNKKVTFEDFQRYFLLVKNPKNKETGYDSNALQTFLEYIVFVAQSFSKVEDVIADSAVDMQQLSTCLSRYYQGGKRPSKNEIVKECLFDLGMYSRLNVFLVFHHMSCHKDNVIPLHELFSTSPVTMETPFTQNPKDMFSCSQSIGQFQEIGNGMPVKWKPEEKHKKKSIGTLIKKSSIRSSGNNKSEDRQNQAPSLIASEKTLMKVKHIDSLTKSVLSNTTAFQISNKRIPNISNFESMYKTSMSRINSRTTMSRVNAYMSRQICLEPRISRYKGQLRVQYASLQKR